MSNLAITARAALIATVHSPLKVTLSQPDHCAAWECGAGAPLRVRVEPLTKLALHVAPHSIPAGALVTVPAPEPTFSTLSASTGRLKVALTSLSSDIVTSHSPSAVTASQPDQIGASASPEGLPVSVTVGSSAKAKAQVKPQLMPAGELVTVPVPVPAFLTVSV